MSGPQRDTAFLRLAGELRPVLRRCARLLYPARSATDPEWADRADRIVDQALAQAYADGCGGAGAVFRALVRPDWRLVGSANSPRIQLVDVAYPTAGPLAELSRLELSTRAVVVLTLVAGLRAELAADIAGVPAEQVPALLNLAGERLVGAPEYRRDPAELPRRLAVLAHHSTGPAWPLDTLQSASLDDLARGRRLRRQRRLRRWGALAAALIVVAVSAAFLVKPAAEPTAPPPPIAPTTAPSHIRSAPCDPSVPACQARLVRRWRVGTSAIMAERLDRRGRYFSGYSYAYNASYDSPGLWGGQGGALALEMGRLDGGATEVYLQIATAARFADRCGQRTRRRCTAVRFMSGDSFLISGSTSMSGGTEVQYAPGDGKVITVVARNVSGGRSLRITTADLVDLVQDPRLQLPRL